jgi:hypothetical protein
MAGVRKLRSFRKARRTIQLNPRPPFGLNRTIPILGTLCFQGLFLLPYATAWMNSRSLRNEEDQRDDERGQNA